MSSFDRELDKLAKKNQCSNEAEEQLHKHITNECGDKGRKREEEKESEERNDSLLLECA